MSTYSELYKAPTSIYDSKYKSSLMRHAMTTDGNGKLSRRIDNSPMARSYLYILIDSVHNDLKTQEYHQTSDQRRPYNLDHRPHRHT